MLQLLVSLSTLWDIYCQMVNSLLVSASQEKFEISLKLSRLCKLNFKFSKAWCTLKLILALFQQLDEYYWLKHYQRDHQLQRNYMKKLKLC